VLLGDDDFIDEMQSKVTPDKDLTEITFSEKCPIVKELPCYAKKYKKETKLFQQPM